MQCFTDKSLIYFMINNRVLIPTNGSYHLNLYYIELLLSFPINETIGSFIKAK